MNEITKLKVDKEKKKILRYELSKEFKQIKNNLISLKDELQSNKKYHTWINEQRKHIIPIKNKFDENNILYDLKSNTQDYLKPLIYIGKELEKINDNIKIKQQKK